MYVRKHVSIVSETDGNDQAFNILIGMINYLIETISLNPCREVSGKHLK